MAFNYSRLYELQKEAWITSHQRRGTSPIPPYPEYEEWLEMNKEQMRADAAEERYNHEL